MSPRCVWHHMVGPNTPHLHTVKLQTLAFQSQPVDYTHMNKLQITLPTLISHTCQMWISLFTVLSHDTAIIIGVLTQKPLRVIVTVDVDFGQCVVCSWLLTTLMNSGFQPRQEKF